MRTPAALITAGLFLLLSACDAGSTDSGILSQATETPAVEQMQVLGPAPDLTRLPPKLSTGIADVEKGRLVWISGAKSYGLDHHAVWTTQQNGKRRLVARVEKGLLATGIGLSFPNVVWVEYREVGNTTGPWKIVRHDLRTKRNSVIARWDERGPEREEAIPLPSLDGSMVAWHQLMRDESLSRRFCIQIHDLEAGTTRSEGCTTDLETFPHWARVNNDRVAYVTNTGRGDEGACGISFPPPRFAQPRSPDYPRLAELFVDDGPLSGRRLATRIAEADDRGVAWITEGACYGDPGGIFYWEPGREPASRPEVDPEFPALEVFLVGDAIVWSEPDVANDVFAVRRDLLSCTSAAVPIATRWFKEKLGRLKGGGTDRGYAIDLLGASDSEILVSLQKSGGRVTKQTLGIFRLPPLPTECPSG